MRRLHVFIGLLAALVSIPRVAPAANVADFIDFSLRNPRNQVTLPGRLYVPPEATSDPTTPRPFILFFHGAGEDGTNNTSQINGPSKPTADPWNCVGISWINSPRCLFTASNWLWHRIR
jgi:hypothetical protein